MTASLDWLWFVAACVLGALGAVVVVWALLWDRARGRLRCPRCWYDMAQFRVDDAGLHTCPECGRKGLRDRSLRRTRRRWRAATLAIVLLAAAPVVGQMPELLKRGWMYVIPDRALFYALPLGGMGGAFGQELQRRIGAAAWPDGTTQATLSVPHRAALIRRAAAGTIFARPIGGAWRESYGRLIRAYQRFLYNPYGGRPGFGGSPDPPAVTASVQALNEIPHALEVRTRDRWPKGMSPSVQFEVRHWWAEGSMDSIANIEWSTAAGSSGKSRGGRGQFELPIHDTGPVTAVLRLDVVREDSTVTPQARVTAGHEERSITYTTVDSIDDILQPLSDAQTDAALAGGLALREQPPGDLSIDTHAIALPMYCYGVAFGMRVEVSHNGRPILTAHARWKGSAAPISWTYGDVNTVDDWKTAQAYIAENSQKPGWTVRISTDEAWALAVLEATRYWKGDLTFPVTINQGLLIQRSRTTAPPAKN